MTRTILIVDDEATQLMLMQSVVTRLGYKAKTAENGMVALDILLKPKCDVDLVILDLSMPELSGIDVLNRLKPQRPDLPVIILTAHASVNKVVDAMQAGASDFISKPASAERIRVAMENAFSKSAGDYVGELEPVKEAFSSASSGSFKSIIGNSTSLSEAIRIAQKAATTSIPILIGGESGTGKEVFAKAIHQASPRAKQSFVAVNCGAIPENLVESILFGHEKGAFTGANDRHFGKFEEASGGTLFLDEIGELPLDIQVKLLRAIQEGEIERVGGNETIKVDIRLLSATNRDLSKAVDEGQFREDLFYRLNVFPLSLPPLRQRDGDVILLTNHFIDIISKGEGIKPKKLAPATKALIEAYHWPGNIRQLQNAVFRAVVLSEGSTLEPEDFPQLTTAPALTASPDNSLAATSVGASNGQGIALTQGDGHIRPFEDIEKDIIQQSINHYNGKLSEVARRLGLGRSTLYRKMDTYGISKK